MTRKQKLQQLDGKSQSVEEKKGKISIDQPITDRSHYGNRVPPNTPMASQEST